MSARRTIFADILKPDKVREEEGSAPAQIAPSGKQDFPKKKAPKLNKAVNPEYMKLTAYIPRDLHFQIKTAMAAEHESDQSAYVERWLRESLQRHQSAAASKRDNSIES